MRALHRSKRQLNIRLTRADLYRWAVRIYRRFDRWASNGELLPKSAERGAGYALAFYFCACVVIWTAVYFKDHLNIFWVNQ